MSEKKENGTPTDVAQSFVTEDPDHAFDWLKNEHSLRDEGAYYGLVEGNTVEKESAIRQYFEVSIQALRVGIEIDLATTKALKEEIAQLEDHIVAVEQKRTALLTPDDHVNHFFFRYVLGLSVYALMLLFNFGLIYETLSLSSQYPLWISLGVYLFGMLSLIRRMAIVYSNEDQVVSDKWSAGQRWKIYFEEVGIPLVAALFVVFYGNTPSATHASLVFILVFALFLYAGKGFWQSWLHIQEEYGIWQNHRAAKRIRLDKVSELNEELQRLKTLLEQKKQAIADLQANIRTQQVHMAKTEARKVATVHYFKSEYDLARSTKRMGVFG